MDFSERIAELSKKVKSVGDTLITEEATKNALVMPFIAALGYDVFNPSEVVPEFSAAIGEYKDARVDYAILSDGKPIILIECKAMGVALDSKQCNQLQLYFHGTEAPIAVLTDGNRYMFFSDLDAANKMDSKPYMDFTLSDMDDALVPELRKLAKGRFDKEVCLSAANELKYNREFRRILGEQLEKPHDDFVRFFISQAYEGPITQKVRERFTPVLLAAIDQFINDKINARLKNAMLQKPEVVEPAPVTATEEIEQPAQTSKNGVVTTEEEKEGFYLVKSILMGVVDLDRVKIQDWQAYCNIVLDSRRKPLLRMHFNNKPWFIGLFDGDNNDDKVEIEKLEDILPYADRIRATAVQYDDASKK